ncbi:MAG: phenylalanine--tRNA ligase subunit beta [Dehalogenimonas sp.]|uniref:Phenylalanine--tRNA ligase beta subunit n=1 Tax=Candidatus Dehalogenimonas loeffleri TaxID=3127115 RepID=A0ABZ2JBS5_9CHLR|nr:phenylalanine--tRNA ligase subunit beta [Dehalogenimonas sp.]
MKAPISWLKEYVEINRPVKEIAERLTLAGNEVSAITSTVPAWGGIVVAEVTAVESHPNADRLRLVTLNTGAESQPRVVCGAPNVAVGQKVAFAGVGVKLVDGHTGQAMELKPAVIRGVESCGMVLSEKELGLSDNHEGILVLDAETRVGLPLADVLGDQVLDIEVTPNRSDCLSITGIAREVAAVTGQNGIKLPDTAYEESETPVAESVTVEIKAPDLCPRYTAAVIKGIKVGPSPEWLQKRLTDLGQRPINNIVDITNFVMLEYGQPLHAFDLKNIKGGKISVRRAEEGEKFVTLDDEERTLTADTLMIGDAERSIAIAGVMGGANSEVSDTTTDIVLESANFNAASIHHTAGRLKLTSEASTRFERNLNPELPPHALKRAAQLVLQIAGGQAQSGIVDAYPGKKYAVGIMMAVDRISAVLGSRYDFGVVTKSLKALGLTWYVENNDEEDFGMPAGTQFLRVYQPWWRTDLNIPEDIIEEVARIIGYDNIPARPLSGPIPKRVGPPIMGFKKLFRTALVGYGFQELLSLSLTSEDAMRRGTADGELKGRPVRLLNPMSSEQEILRTSLRPALFAAVAANRRYEPGGMRLFEIGRVYNTGDGPLPVETEMVCGVVAGEAEPAGWQQGKRGFDFYDVKGLIETILNRMQVNYKVEVSQDAGLRPGVQASFSIDDITFGVIGEVHPRVAASFDVAETLYLFEVDLAVLMQKVKPGRAYEPLPRYPAVVRDIALVVDAAVSHQQVLDTLSAFPLLKSVSLFDVYAGKQLEGGKKSLAYRLAFQSAEETLTDEKIDKVMAEIFSTLGSELGAKLRS